MEKKFKIGLKDNGTHSLRRGLEMFQKYEEVKDSFMLKESIMFLHHGIELLMKQVLIEKAGEYLIFADISDETIKKVIEAKKGSVSVFDLDKPPHTSTYLAVIKRVRAFVENPALEESLETRLINLNKTRNNLEHYAINANIYEIENLITSIRKPLITFFERSLKDFKKHDSKSIENKWQKVDENILHIKEKENEVIEILKKMSGKALPGNLFSNLLNGSLQIPEFEEIVKNHNLEIDENTSLGIDVFAKGKKDKNWIIEVKTNIPDKHLIRNLDMLNLFDSTIWLVVFNEIPKNIKDLANKKNIYFTDLNMFQNLKDVLEASN